MVTMNTGGKGSGRRPSEVSTSQVDANWELIFGKKQAKEEVEKIKTPAPVGFKFQLEDVVFHLKTEHYYLVRGLPDRYVIEETDETAYAYQRWDPNTHQVSGPWIIRSRTKMEDGRFIRSLCEQS